MRKQLQKISEYKWLIPRASRQKMLVDAVIYANKHIMETVEDTAIQQLTNVACLPGVLNPVIGMPDMHWGYGLPMGAIGAFDKDEGVISCGCTGYDINCGVFMLSTSLAADEVKPKIDKLVSTLFANVPCGVGATSRIKLTNSELNRVLLTGARWAVDNGYGTPADLTHMEENGCLDGADPAKISQEALKRGAPQLGTLGAGNHFLEVQAIDQIFNRETAAAYGLLERDQVTVMVHCGSRGLGHQVATDYLQIHDQAARKYGITLPDPQLVCAPAAAPEGQDYLKAMNAAANYAFCNRLMIAHWIRQSFEAVFKKSWQEMKMHTVYDVAHNICKLETHTVQGVQKQVYVHRKGATRAFPPGHAAVPEVYREFGQPVLIAGSMGTASYVLAGTETAMADSFGSSCHGAGRKMGRGASLKQFRGDKIRQEMEKAGRAVRSTNLKILAEEAPGAYKNVDEVIKSVAGAGVSQKVARVVPLGVAKG